MTYTKHTWNAGKAGGTPITAVKLNEMEDGIAAAATTAGVAADVANPASTIGSALSDTIVTVGETKFISFVTASGDTSGAADSANIAAALVSSKTVVLNGSSGEFFIEDSIILGGGNANTLLIWNATVNLVYPIVDDESVNIVTNHWARDAIQGYGSAPDSGIHVRGIGEAILVGNDNGALMDAGVTGWNNWGIFLVNTTYSSVKGVHVKKTQAGALTFVGSSHCTVDDVEVTQNNTLTKDAFDIGPGNTFLTYTNIRGTAGDDFISIWAKQGALGAASNNTTPWANAAFSASPSNLTTSYIKIDGVRALPGAYAVRLNAGDGATLSHVTISNAEFWGGVVMFGETSFVTTPPTPAQFTCIKFDKFRTITNGYTAFNFETNVSRIEIDAVIDGTFPTLFGRETGTTTATTVTDVSARIVSGDTTNAKGNRVMVNRAGDAWTGFDIDVHAATVTNLLNNAGTAQLGLRAVVNTIASTAVISTGAETGWLDLQAVRTSGIFSHASALRVVNAPGLTNADTLPSPTLQSRIICRSDIAPTQDGSGGVFVGDGYEWNLETALPNYVQAPVLSQVESANFNSSGGANVAHITLSKAYSAGDLLVIAGGIYQTSPLVTITSITDAVGGNTYTVDTTGASGTTTSAFIARSLLTSALPAGTVLTLNFSANIPGNSWYNVASFTGVAASPLDVVASNNSTTAVTSISSGTTGTTTQRGDLAIAAFGFNAPIGSIVFDPAWTLIRYIPDPYSLRDFAWAYRTVSPEQTVAATATIGTAHGYAGVVATYKRA